MVFFLAQHTFMRLDSKAKGYKIENGFQFMNHKKIYRTNQKETVLNYIQNYPQAHFTAADLFASLKQEGYKIGLTTVYRHLDRLVDEGILVKSIVDENTPACFELSGHDGQQHSACYHCKCTKCGKLIHLHCDEITKLEQHILADHGFMVLPERTVFFGICQECRMAGGETDV